MYVFPIFVPLHGNFGTALSQGKMINFAEV